MAPNSADSESCYSFRPTDEKLITVFLEKKVRGIPIPQAHPVTEKLLYNDVPWNVLKEDDPWEDSESPNKKTIIVFSKLIYINEKTKNRVVRTAGHGTWNGKTPPQDIKNSTTGKVIGHKRSFTFRPQKGYESEMKGKGRWIMHEFSLARHHRNNGDYVICRISKDMSKEFLNRDDDQLNDQVSDTGSTACSTTTLETNRKRKPCGSFENHDHHHQQQQQKKKAWNGIKRQENREIMSSPISWMTDEIFQYESSKTQKLMMDDNNDRVFPYIPRPKPLTYLLNHHTTQQEVGAAAPFAEYGFDGDINLVLRI